MKLRLIFTLCCQDGSEHYSSVFKVVEVNTDDISKDLLDRWAFVGAEIVKEERIEKDDY
jgi:hypothetical protein